MRLSNYLPCRCYRPQLVLGISKLSAWEFVKARYPNLCDDELKNRLVKQGNDPEEILNEHNLQVTYEKNLGSVLKKLNINFRILKRIKEASECVRLADLIIPIGGDGTFLLASKLITDNTKSVIGVNPCPEPHSSILAAPLEYSIEIEKMFEKLLLGEYTLMMRSRIRVEMIGEGLYRKPFHVHEKSRSQGERRIDALVKSTQREIVNALQPRRRILPWLALNEVFMGEFLAPRAITFRFQADNNEEYTVRSSGICVCTGSGSRFWYRGMNIQPPDTVQQLALAIGKKMNEKEAKEVLHEYYNALDFHPEDRRMAYMIREMYRASNWPKPRDCPERQMCHRITVKSCGFDAGLILDGSVSLPFNDGTIAFFEIRPEYALKNIILT
ncbi:NAD kinase 2, mitochondrial-like [Prorops nasuta]|uniref:NAD kinase 2, mitochondrial-like n=1 Tax=Prorops nasuta TaxID=863751 RepID=UPI0034CEA932